LIQSDDRYYTPPQIARALVRASGKLEPAIVADFAAGDGGLLTVARATWPKCTVIATDIDRTQVSELRARERGWRVGRCDLFNSKSQRSCLALRGTAGKVALILLNPPFSCRGGSYRKAALSNDFLKCSVALAFVVESLKYLAPTGRLVAIMPASTLHSDKDRAPWAKIQIGYEVEVVAQYQDASFPGCAARTVMVRLSPRNHPNGHRRLASTTTGPYPLSGQLTISRGQLQMHTLANSAGTAMRLAHTTDLREGVLKVRLASVGDRHHTIRGPVVLMPRVGEPNATKIAVYAHDEPILVSDCIIAIHCQNLDQALAVKRAMVERWPAVRRLYGGTAAAYTTIRAVSEFFRRLGCTVSAASVNS